MKLTTLALMLMLAACAGRRAAPANANAGAARTWIPFGWSKAGARPDLFEVGVDSSIRRTGMRSAYIASRGGVTDGAWATLSQGVDASPYIGRRVTIAAWLRRDSPGPCQGFVGIDGEIEGKRVALAFASELENPQPCGTEWRRFSVVLEVPRQARRMVYGYRLSGPGRVWTDDVTVGPADNAVLVSSQLDGLPAEYSEAELRALDSVVVELKARGEWTERPTNLGFEE